MRLSVFLFLSAAEPGFHIGSDYPHSLPFRPNGARNDQSAVRGVWEGLGSRGSTWPGSTGIARTHLLELVRLLPYHTELCQTDAQNIHPRTSFGDPIGLIRRR